MKVYGQSRIAPIAFLFLWSIGVFLFISTRAKADVLVYERVPTDEHFSMLDSSSINEKDNNTPAVASTTAGVLPECSCVNYLISLGIPIRGNAIDLVPNIKTPQRGDVMLLTYRDKHTGETIGHAAFVEGPMPGGVYISEWNFVHCTATQRLVSWDDPHIKGYLRVI